MDFCIFAEEEGEASLSVVKVSDEQDGCVPFLAAKERGDTHWGVAMETETIVLMKWLVKCGG